MFHPNLGRWMTMDPVGYAGGDSNLYRAYTNSPVAFCDPFGLTPTGPTEIDITEATKANGNGAIRFIVNSDKKVNIKFLQFVSIKAKISCTYFNSCDVVDIYIRSKHVHGNRTVQIGGDAKSSIWQVDHGDYDGPFYRHDHAPVIRGTGHVYDMYDMPTITSELHAELAKEYDVNKIAAELELRNPKGGKVTCQMQITATFHTYVIIDGKVMDHIVWQTKTPDTSSPGKPKIVSRDQFDISDHFKKIIKSDYPGTDPYK